MMRLAAFPRSSSEEQRAWFPLISLNDEPEGKASCQMRQINKVSEAEVAFSFSSYSTGQMNIFVFYCQETVRCSLPTLFESLFSP